MPYNSFGRRVLKHSQVGGPDRSQIFAELTQRQQKITLSQYESAGNDAGGIAQVAQAVQNTLGSKLSAAMDERG